MPRTVRRQGSWCPHTTNAHYRGHSSAAFLSVWGALLRARTTAAAGGLSESAASQALSHKARLYHRCSPPQSDARDPQGKVAQLLVCSGVFRHRGRHPFPIPLHGVPRDEELLPRSAGRELSTLDGAQNGPHAEVEGLRHLCSCV